MTTKWPLHIAAERGQLEIIDILLKHRGFKIDAYNDEGQTPLILAIENDHSETVGHLIDKGANVIFKNSLGQAPLHVAVLKNKHNFLERLMANTTKKIKKVALNVKDKESNTPLLLAVKNQYTECTDTLIKMGARLDISDAWGKFPLHNAVERTDIATIKLLLTFQGQKTHS